MNIFDDQKSGYKFCMKNVKNFEGISDYGLIKWCEQYLTEDSTFVDIGSHIGSYSIILSKKCKKVVAFEPEKEIFECMAINTCINNIFNIEMHNVGIGYLSKDLSEEKILYQLSEDGLQSTLKEGFLKSSDVIKSQKVIVKTLDSYNLTNVDFIKINVNGYELEVLKSGFSTLFNNNFPPIVFRSIENELLFQFIKGLGYKIFPINGHPNTYLASDHFSRIKTIKVEEKSIPKYDIKDLITSYEKNEEFDDWEAYWMLSHHLRLLDKKEECYDLAIKALKQKPPKNKLHLIYEEISIVSFYLNKKEEGLISCENVVLDPHAEWEKRNLALSNQRYYMEKLEVKNVFEIKFDMPEKYSSSTASIIRKDDIYKLNLRGVNYILTQKGGYISRHGDDIIRTVNFILDLDKNFNILNHVEVKNRTDIPLYPKNILGMEDIRLISNTNYFFCTYPEVNNSRTPQICWCTYDESGNVTRIVPLMVDNVLKCEKNWMPFMYQNRLLFIYSIRPFRLFEIDIETGVLTELKNIVYGDKYLNDFRGSAMPIPYKNGWLCTIHQVFHSDPRKYFHRFVWFNEDFTEMNYSFPFYFETPSIEFNLSLCDGEDGVLITYSCNDSNSLIATVEHSISDERLSKGFSIKL
jgi:FkbM family methyltransferase